MQKSQYSQKNKSKTCRKLQVNSQSKTKIVAPINYKKSPIHTGRNVTGADGYLLVEISGIRRKRLARFRNSEESELVHFSERLRSTNRALHCAFRGHFVSDLLAMKLHSMSANATRLRLSSFVISPQGFARHRRGTNFSKFAQSPWK